MTTYSIDQMSGTPADYSMQKISEASFAKKRTEVIPGGQKTIYVLATSDDGHEVSLVIQSKLDKNGNGGRGVRTSLIALNSWARTVVTDKPDVVDPISTVLTINLPVGAGVEVADLRSMVEVLYSSTYSTLTSKLPDTAHLTALAYMGLTEIIG